MTVRPELGGKDGGCIHRRPLPEVPVEEVTVFARVPFTVRRLHRNSSSFRNAIRTVWEERSSAEAFCEIPPQNREVSDWIGICLPRRRNSARCRVLLRTNQISGEDTAGSAVPKVIFLRQVVLFHLKSGPHSRSAPIWDEVVGRLRKRTTEHHYLHGVTPEVGPDSSTEGRSDHLDFVTKKHRLWTNFRTGSN